DIERVRAVVRQSERVTESRVAADGVREAAGTHRTGNDGRDASGEIDLADDVVVPIGDIEVSTAVERQARREGEHLHVLVVGKNDLERRHGASGEIDLPDGKYVADVQVALAIGDDAGGKFEPRLGADSVDRPRSVRVASDG